MQTCERPDCGKEFEPDRSNQKFCSRKCGLRVRNERYWKKKLGVS